MISNLLAGIGCVTLLGAGCLAALAWALVSSEVGKMVVGRALGCFPAPAPSPRPAPDDLRPRGEK